MDSPDTSLWCISCVGTTVARADGSETWLSEASSGRRGNHVFRSLQATRATINRPRKRSLHRRYARCGTTDPSSSRPLTHLRYRPGDEKSHTLLSIYLTFGSTLLCPRRSRAPKRHLQLGQHSVIGSAHSEMGQGITIYAFLSS